MTGSAAGAPRPPRTVRPARVSLPAVSAVGEAGAATQQSAGGRGASAASDGVTAGPQSLPVAPPRRRRPSGRLVCSVGDLLDTEECRPRLVPLESDHRVPSATTRLTIPLSGVRSPESGPSRDPGRPPSGAAATPADRHSRLETRPDSSHDSSERSHVSTTPAAPRPRPRRHSKSTGSLLFASGAPASPPTAAPRSLRLSIGRPLSEHGAKTSVQLTPGSASQPTSERRQEPEPESELERKRPAVIRVQSPVRQPISSAPDSHTEPEPEPEPETDSSSPDGSESPLSARRVISPLSADSVSDLSAAVGSERRTYRSRPSETGASPATPLFTKHGGSSTERRRTQSAFNARRTIAHRRQAEAAGSRSSSEPRRRHTATWVTGKINVSVTSVGRAASLTQLGAGGVSRALAVSDRSSSSPTLEQEKRDIRRYLYSSNLTSGSESPERERRLSEGCLRLGAPEQGDALSDRAADPRLLSPNSVGSGWSAVTADVLTTRDAADDRCDVTGDRTDSGMAGAVELEREGQPGTVPAPATGSVRRRLSTSVVHLWGPDESHILPSGPSSLPSTALRTKQPRPQSLSSSALLAESDQQPSWLRQSQERRGLRESQPSWSAGTAHSEHPGTAGRPVAALANGQPTAERVTSESRVQPAAECPAIPAPSDLTSKSTDELSSEVPSNSPIESFLEPLSDRPPPPPSHPPPESPPESPPPLPSEPPPVSPTDPVPEPPWTSRFERPRRQSLSTSLPSFATVPVVAEGAASVGRKPPSVAPLSLWSDSQPGLPGRPAARRPLRPTPAVSAPAGPSSLPADAPGSSSSTAERPAVRPAPAALPSDRTTVQVRVQRPGRTTGTASTVRQRPASTGVYLNGAAPTESRTKTSFTISLGGGGRKRPSLFSQHSSPGLLASGQPTSLPTQSSKSPSSPPPAKQPSSLPGLRHGAARQPTVLSSPSAASPPSTGSARQPASLPSLATTQQPTSSTRREPTSLPTAPPPLPKSPPPARSSPVLRSPPSLRSSLRSPVPPRSPPRSPAAARPADGRRGSSDLQRQLEDDWARMERRHQAFLRHTAQQRGQPAPRSILKKQSAPSLLESVVSEERPGWTRDEQPRRRASNVNWHDLERTKQQIRAEIERMKRQLRTEIGTGRAGPWPPRSAGVGSARPAGSTASSSHRRWQLRPNRGGDHPRHPHRARLQPGPRHHRDAGR